MIELLLAQDEAQELLARLLLSQDDDNDLSAAIMRRLAKALQSAAERGLQRA